MKSLSRPLAAERTIDYHFPFLKFSHKLRKNTHTSCLLKNGGTLWAACVEETVCVGSVIIVMAEGVAD